MIILIICMVGAMLLPKKWNEDKGVDFAISEKSFKISPLGGGTLSSGGFGLGDETAVVGEKRSGF